MFAAFIVVLGLTGQPVGGGESTVRYDTIEASDAENAKQAAHVAQTLTDDGVAFGEIRVKCDDPAKHTLEVFGLGAPA